MADTFTDYLAQQRRRTILELLRDQGAAGINHRILAATLTAMGVSTSEARAETDLAFLAEQGLVALEKVGPLAVAKVRTAGLEHLSGVRLAPGVARPEVA